MKKIIWIGIISSAFIACNRQVDVEKLKDDVEKTELAFAQMASDQSIAEAFAHFADENAVLMRNNQLVEGKEAILNYTSQGIPPGAKLEWAPDFVDVAKSGDLAYTYGKFTFTYSDTSGTEQSASGIFHTVWKRQEDGSWRYVWD